MFFYSILNLPTIGCVNFVPPKTIVSNNKITVVPVGTIAISKSVASSSTSTTVTHTAGTKALVVGDTFIVSGHTGNAAMNQAYTITTVTSATEVVLTGGGMTAGTYNSGTIIGTYKIGSIATLSLTYRPEVTGNWEETTTADNTLKLHDTSSYVINDIVQLCCGSSWIPV